MSVPLVCRDRTGRLRATVVGCLGAALLVLVPATAVEARSAVEARPAAAGRTDVGAVVLVVDASGSMLDRDQDGARKIDAAKRALRNLINEIPAGTPLGLRVFGQRGALSASRSACRDSDLLLPVRPVRRSAMRSALGTFEARGWTPLAYALAKGAKDLPAGRRGSVVLISDGVDECFPRFGPEPCAVARDLAKDKIDLKVQTIGITASASARRQLKCIARVTGGRYWDVDDASSLADALSGSIPRAAPAAPVVVPPPPSSTPLGASALVVVMATGVAGLVAGVRSLLRKRQRAYW